MKPYPILAGFFLLIGSLLSSSQASEASGGPGSTLVLPDSVPQGGLIRGKLPAGSELLLLSSTARETGPGADLPPPVPVRLTGDGRFVIGVGRDETGPIRLKATLPDQGNQEFVIPVVVRQWQIERIEGVPQSTVTPPPAIAARIEREQAQVYAARQRDDDRNDFDASFSWPLKGRISGVYGSQRIYNGTAKSPHSGLDIAAARGTPVHAPAGGVISFASPDLYLTGGTILIDHGHGLSSNFLHLSRLDVKVGDRVTQGQIIGLVGATGRATGPHMHWGMNWFTVRVDPQLLLDATTDPAASGAIAAPSR